ncbi:conserved hypothetical protein [Culex quinquefasciatus]|uniref:EF-hand domain-containing protein n=1 Tax=Culex quinquefasciatus TaxID=7176 RepID=B0WSU3_CULQU|nr:conserved hypothetical protein [Culex quinquefasciatus]|eukprot:XP_001870712.1 conserved hypothetical protein [Culex quinquefasciatus]
MLSSSSKSNSPIFFSSFCSGAAAAAAAPPDGIEDRFSRPKAISYSTDLPFSSMTSLVMRVESASIPTDRRFENCATAANDPERSMTVIDFREYLLMSLFLITLYSPKLNFVKALFYLYGDHGKVSREAFHSTLQYLVKITPPEADAIFLSADSGNLGEISFDQFTSVLDKFPAIQKKLQKNNDPNNLRLT